MSGAEVTGLIVLGTVAAVGAVAGVAGVAALTIYGLMRVEARVMRANRQRATR